SFFRSPWKPLMGLVPASPTQVLAAGHPLMRRLFGSRVPDRSNPSAWRVRPGWCVVAIGILAGLRLFAPEGVGDPRVMSQEVAEDAQAVDEAPGENALRATPASRRGVVIRFEGTITPLLEQFIYRALDKARQEEVEVVIIEFDSPGGFL